MRRPSLKKEKKLWEKGYTLVIGADEVGRGAFAGPLVTAAVAFSPFCKLPAKLAQDINDSKKLSPKKREYLSPLIQSHAKIFVVKQVSVTVINRVGIGKATEMAFRKTIQSLLLNVLDSHEKPFLLIDGFYVRYIKHIGLKHQKAIIKGDQISLSIAAASILAKVYRDKLMRNFGNIYPQYGFAQHKGYGTKYHQQAMKRYGLTLLHRTSFDFSSFLPHLTANKFPFTIANDE